MKLKPFLFALFLTYSPNSFAEELFSRDSIPIFVQDNKINFNVGEKTENIIAKSIEELNFHRYQSAIKMINSYLETKKSKGSINLSDAMSTSPWRDAYLILAISYLNLGNEEQALPILNELIFYSDKWEAIYIALCEYYLTKNAFILAKNTALKGLDKLEKPSYLMSVYLAQAELGLKQNDKAQQVLEQALTFFPKNSIILGWLGIVDLRQNRILMACHKFKEGYDTSSKEQAQLTYYHGACLLQSHAYEEAQSVLKVGLYNFNTNANLYYLGGLIEISQGHALEARKYWEKFLKLAEPLDERLSYVKAYFTRSAQNR